MELKSGGGGAKRASPMIFQAASVKSSRKSLFSRWSRSTSAVKSDDKIFSASEPVRLSPSISGKSIKKSGPTRNAVSLLNVASLQRNGFSKSTPHLDIDDSRYSLDMKQPKTQHVTVKNKKLQSQKKLSLSSPVMSGRSSVLLDDDDVDDILTPKSSSSRNKKFHRFFSQVPEDERVLNNFACALISEILLQGNLYITPSYFGFYSNVFGHVTKILIPVSCIEKITREKTVKIIPNAVGVLADGKKHVFGSLLSREAAFKLMQKVWMNHTNTDPSKQEDSDCEIGSPCLERISDSGSQDEYDEDQPVPAVQIRVQGVDEREEIIVEGSMARSESMATTTTYLEQSSSSKESTPVESQLMNGHIQGYASSDPSKSKDDVLSESVSIRVLKSCIEKASVILPVKKMRSGLNMVNNLPSSTLFLLACTVLLLFLFFSASFLIYRLSILQNKIQVGDQRAPEASSHNFQELYRWQQTLHTTSIGHIIESLPVHINQLEQVRRSLELMLHMISAETSRQASKPQT